MASEFANEGSLEFSECFSSDKDTTESDTTPFLNSLIQSDLRKPLLIQYDAYHNTTIAQPLPIDTSKSSIDISHLIETTPWKLNYQDFCPEIHYTDTIYSTDRFCDLVERANSWLRQNPQVEACTCETMCWWTTYTIEVGDTEAVLFKQNIAPINGLQQTTYYVGLRLWLIPKRNDNQTYQIWFKDVFPNERKGLSKLVEKCKSELMKDPIKGSIITMETTFCPRVNDQNNTSLLWKEAANNQSECTIFLRLFYRLLEESVNEEIGTHDFCPEMIGDRYESFGALVKKASKWCGENKYNVKITNLKSLYISKSKDPPPDQESSDYISYCSFNSERKQYFQVLRAFYIIRPTSTNVNFFNFNYVTFSPVQLTPGPPTCVEFEKMQQTIIRVQAWLSASEANIFGVESITTPVMSCYTSQALPEITNWAPSITTSDSSIQKWLLHIRVFLDGECKIPDPSLLLPLPASLILGLHQENYDQEEQLYYYRKKKRKRKKSILFMTCFFTLFFTVILILLDQGFHFINL